MPSNTINQSKSLKHSFSPRGAALAVFHCKDPEVVISGPAGTGKSRACLEKINLMCLKYPGMRALILRKTASSLTSTGLVTWRQFVIPEIEAAGAMFYYGGSQQEPAQYKYQNGSTVTIGGIDKATKIMSSEYDVIFVQEATELTEDDWEMLTTRLRSHVVPYQQIIADCNPSTPTHWLKRRCDEGRATMIKSHHEDNPRLYDDEGNLTPNGATYIGRLDQLSGARLQRLRFGIWSTAEGVVYESYDPAMHLLDPMEIPEDWTRYWSVDFGFINPFVLQCWAEDGDGNLYLYRELYHTKRLVEDHAKQIISIVTRNGEWIEPKPRYVLADHDAEGRQTFEKHTGLHTTAADKKVLKGIEAVESRFKSGRLYIVRDATVERDEELSAAVKPTSTAEELPGYVWDIRTGTKEAPLKENDHGCDAMRYMVAKRDLAGRPNIRWL